MLLIMIVCHIIQVFYTKCVLKKYYDNTRILISMGAVSKRDVTKPMIKKTIPIVFLMALTITLYSIIIIFLLFTKLWPIGICLLILFMKIIFTKGLKDGSNDYIITVNKTKLTFFKIVTIIIKIIAYTLIFILL